MVWSGVLLLMLHFVSDFGKVPSHKVHFHLESTRSPPGVHVESLWSSHGVHREYGTPGGVHRNLWGSVTYSNTSYLVSICNSMITIGCPSTYNFGWFISSYSSAKLRSIGTFHLKACWFSTKATLTVDLAVYRYPFSLIFSIRATGRYISTKSQNVNVYHVFYLSLTGQNINRVIRRTAAPENSWVRPWTRKNISA